MEKWSTEDNFVLCLCWRWGFHLFHLFQWRNNYHPSWQYRSNTVHHCTLKRRSPFINIKPIWAEKLQCPNDVYTSGLMSLLSDIAALPRRISLSQPAQERLMILCCWSPITLCDIYRRLKSKSLNTAIFKGQPLEGIQLGERKKKQHFQRLTLAFICQLWDFDKEAIFKVFIHSVLLHCML